MSPAAAAPLPIFNQTNVESEGNYCTWVNCLYCIFNSVWMGEGSGLQGAEELQMYFSTVMRVHPCLSRFIVQICDCK